MKLVLTILYSLLLYTTFAQSKPTNYMETQLKMDEAEILATVRQLADLMIKRDTTAMNLILDKDYTLTHMTGYVQSKTAWFDEVIKENMKYYSAREISHIITVKENTSSVVVRNLVDARIWGSRNTWRLQQDFQLEKQNDKWIILKSVASTF